MVDYLVFVVFGFGVFFAWLSGNLSGSQGSKDFAKIVVLLLFSLFCLSISGVGVWFWGTSYVGESSWLENGKCYNILSTTAVEGGSVIVLTPIGDNKSVRDVMVNGTEITPGVCYWDGSNFVGILSDPKHTTP